MKILISLLACIFLVGCVPNSAIKKPQPINLNPEEGSYVGVATEANQRLILTTKKPRKAITKKYRKANKSTTASMPIICAEPFPDGGSEYENLNKFISEKGDKKIGLEKNVTFNVTLPHASAPAVKFYRDGVFALCQAAMNGWIGTDLDDDRQQKHCSTAGRSEKQILNNQTQALKELVEQRQISDAKAKTLAKQNKILSNLQEAKGVLDATRKKLAAPGKKTPSSMTKEFTDKMQVFKNKVTLLSKDIQKAESKAAKLTKDIEESENKESVFMYLAGGKKTNEVEADTCTEFEIQMFRLRESAEEIMKTEAEKAKANARTAEANAKKVEAEVKLELEKLKKAKGS